MGDDAGDLYLLKLYRDFVLHQRRDDGSPNLDWGHVVESLNKLDAGIPEKVLLPNGLLPMGLGLPPACIPCIIDHVGYASLWNEHHRLLLVHVLSNKGACSVSHIAESCTLCSHCCISVKAGCR